MTAWGNDLRFAQQAGVAVDVRLFDGQRFQTGVAEVDEETGSVSLYKPQTLGDTTTRVRVNLDDITSLAVTDIQWGQPGNRRGDRKTRQPREDGQSPGAIAARPQAVHRGWK